MNLRSQSQWDAVQESFMDSFVYLLRNYRKFLVFPSKEHEGAYGGAGFRSKEFVQGQRYDMQEFLQQFINTQIFDNFITKRLYGSGEVDVSFFDSAVDRFLKTQGLLSNVDIGGRFLRAKSNTLPSRPKLSRRKTDITAKHFKRNGKEPLLQSARVHRKLKTIVPPEASGEGLPPTPLQKDNTTEGGPVLTEVHSNDADLDESSIGSSSTQETHSTRGTKTNSAHKKDKKKSLQAQAAEILEKSKYRYTYNTFPSKFNPDLFGEPRPLPSSVITEFDRQSKDSARFRRKASAKSGKQQRLEAKGDSESKNDPEVSTFNLFFMAFSAVVGKELMDISENPLLAQDKTIIATYTHTDEETCPSVSETETSLTTTQEEDFEDVVDEEEKEAVAEMKKTRPDLGGLLGEDDDEDEEDLNYIENTFGGGNLGALGIEENNSLAEANGSPEEKHGDMVSNGNGSAYPTEVEIEDKGETSSVVDERPAGGDGSEGAQTPTKEETKDQGAKPRSRFTMSLSKAQIEEAQSTGRAQLALAFEMLTML